MCDPSTSSYKVPYSTLISKFKHIFPEMLAFRCKVHANRFEQETSVTYWLLWIIYSKSKIFAKYSSSLLNQHPLEQTGIGLSNTADYQTVPILMSNFTVNFLFLLLYLCYTNNKRSIPFGCIKFLSWMLKDQEIADQESSKLQKLMQ